MRSDSPKSTARSTSASVVERGHRRVRLFRCRLRGGLGRRDLGRISGGGRGRGLERERLERSVGRRLAVQQAVLDGERAHGIRPEDRRVLRSLARVGRRLHASRPAPRRTRALRAPRPRPPPRAAGRARAGAGRAAGSPSSRATASSGSSPIASATVRTKPRTKPSGCPSNAPASSRSSERRRDRVSADELFAADAAQLPLPRQPAAEGEGLLRLGRGR